MRYLIALLALLLPTLALAEIAGPAKVIDGDTIEAIRSLVDARLNHDRRPRRPWELRGDG